jgi:hypothetical protein
MIDMRNPAGWKEEPGVGFEKKRPMRPPMIEPAMPKRADFQNPRCCRPGIKSSAIPPTMAPTMMDQIMCNMVFLLKAARLSWWSSGPPQNL